MWIILAVITLASVLALWVISAWKGVLRNKAIAPLTKPEINRYQRIAGEQAEALKAAKPLLSSEGTTWTAWMEECINHLRKMWIGMSYDDAKRTILDHIEGVDFPDPAFDWSITAAREIAREIVADYGEEYGENS